MKLRLPWAKEPRALAEQSVTATPATCTHPRVDVEMHGTAIKRRWCTVCGADLPVATRGAAD